MIYDNKSDHLNKSFVLSRRDQLYNSITGGELFTCYAESDNRCKEYIERMHQMNKNVNAITKYEFMLATACITGLEGILSAIQFEDDFLLEEINRTLLPIIEPQINFIERVIDETNEEESYKSFEKDLQHINTPLCIIICKEVPGR